LYFNYLLLVSTTYAYIEYYGIIHALYKFKRLSTKYNGHRLADNKTTKKAYRPSLFIREVPTRPPFPFVMTPEKGHRLRCTASFVVAAYVKVRLAPHDLCALSLELFAKSFFYI
jgi:hypothetical protein